MQERPYELLSIQNKGLSQDRDDALPRIFVTSTGRTDGRSSWQVRMGEDWGDWEGVGKKEWTRPLARLPGVVAFGMRGREAGGGSRKRLAAQSSSSEAVSRKFRQWAILIAQNKCDLLCPVEQLDHA